MLRKKERKKVRFELVISSLFLVQDNQKKRRNVVFSRRRQEPRKAVAIMGSGCVPVGAALVSAAAAEAELLLQPALQHLFQWRRPGSGPAPSSLVLVWDGASGDRTEAGSLLSLFQAVGNQKQ